MFSDNFRGVGGWYWRLGSFLAVGSISGQNGPFFLCGRPFLAVFMADLVVEALGKPHNRPFWLHGSLRPWFRKALASKASLSPPLPVWAWLRM